jgi:hypothetical protein
MDKLRAHKIIAARDYYYSYVIYLEELKLAGGQGYFARLFDCFRVPRIRRGNYGASTVMIAQQMCGINSKTRRQFRSHKCEADTTTSHLFLQFDHLRACAGRREQGAVRLLGLWCYPSGVHHPDIVLDRYQGQAYTVSNRKLLTSSFET